MWRCRRVPVLVTAIAVVAAVLGLTPGTSASAPAGVLDQSFGESGVVRRNVGGAFASTDQGNAVLVQPDGRVLVAGQGGLPNGNFVLMRVLADGRPDVSFGVDGLANNSFSSTFSGATALALQPDGKIVAGGFASAGISHRLAIVRYLPNGALDTSFSGDGLVTGVNIDGFPPGLVNGLVVQGDGKIVTISDTTRPSGTTAEAVRFNTDGSLDVSFGTGGHVVLTAQTTSTIALQSDGRIIVAAATTSAPYKMVVTRLTPNGDVDTSFGSTGIALVGSHAGSDAASAVAVGPSDAISVGGKGSNGNGSEISVVRLTADGALDVSFGTGGYTNMTVSDSYVAVHGLAFQTDAKMLAVGGFYANNAYRWFMARYQSSGSVDTTFGTNGLVTFESGDALAVAIGSDGAFVTGAQGTSGDLMIYKFGIGTTTPPTTTTTVSPTTTLPATTTTTSIGAPAIGSRFIPVEPTRILDTRNGAAHKVRAGTSIDVAVAGVGVGVGVVAPTATAVVINVTATDADGPGYVTVWPAGAPRPEASSLNVASTAGTIANLVTMALTASGALSLFTESGTHLIVDLLGYYAPVTTPVAAGRFQALPAVRVLDTRPTGVNAPTVADFSINAIPGIPPGRASAIVVNLTAAGSTNAGFVTVWPRASGAQPPTSNLNVDAAAQTRANQVIVAVGDGTIRLATTTGAHLIVDVVGYITNDSSPTSTSGLFIAFSPRRVLDTRSGIGVPAGIIGPGQHRDFDARNRVPVDNVAAIVGNVTATQSAAPGFVTIWPRSDTPRPEVSTLNLDAADQTRANHAIMPITPEGQLSAYAETGTHLIVDLTGAFLA